MLSIVYKIWSIEIFIVFTFSHFIRLMITALFNLTASYLCMGWGWTQRKPFATPLTVSCTIKCPGRFVCECFGWRSACPLARLVPSVSLSLSVCPPSACLPACSPAIYFYIHSWARTSQDTENTTTIQTVIGNIHHCTLIFVARIASLIRI